MNNQVGSSAGANQACASCKHQRKKCHEGCELAPYFPASRYGEFTNAQRLYGVSNIQKMMASVEPHKRHDTAESILMEGNARRSDPVNGSLSITRNLQSQILFYQNQLTLVNQQLAFFRHQRRHCQQQNLQDSLFISSSLSASSTSTTAATSSEPHQHDQSDDHDALKFPPPPLDDHLPLDQAASDIDYMGDAKNLQQVGYIYRSTLEEGADLKPFDIQTDGSNYGI
ncbi:hypothetical protein FNV43_RR17889 [Rhamnella rubrinervis]|uniref:LOB domain-containing protein n=1 Tax=Rhamnella rubrinervis TaxID=2594499 RepID=A0A8K0DZP3_9ROSA|nr:hypothetical protein FNV43_RR17889 [Rhamnella rubrinervis]